MRNVPDGLAVMFSLPIGCGRTPAISQFETTQPMATSVDFQHRHVDELALAASLAAKQRGGDRVGRGDAAHRVGDRIADAQRRRLRVAGDAHHAGQPLDDLVVGRIEPQRPVLAEARDRAIDQVGLDAP